jgi:predicted transcriptional regulator
MNAKEEVIKMIEDLPNNTTLEEIIEQLSVKAKIEKGMTQLNNGEFYSHDEVKKKFANWLSEDGQN